MGSEYLGRYLSSSDPGYSALAPPSRLAGPDDPCYIEFPPACRTCVLTDDSYPKEDVCPPLVLRLRATFVLEIALRFMHSFKVLPMTQSMV